MAPRFGRPAADALRHPAVSRRFVTTAALWLSASLAHATFNPNPPVLNLFPTQVGTVNVTITFPPAMTTGSGQIAFTGFPPAAFAYQLAGGTPVPVTFSWTIGSTSSTTSFFVSSLSNVPPGTYTVTMTEASALLGAGSGTLVVTFRYASMTASATPNPVTLRRGGPAASVQVTTMADPGLNTCINYSFINLPAFIQISVVSPPIAQSCEPLFIPIQFAFSASAAAVPGTYTGRLHASYDDNQSNPVVRDFPFTVIIEPPDILASFTQPVMTVCRGAPPVPNTILLSPAGGYVGTPTLAFIAIPTGILISPTNPAAAAMPPGQSVPFAVAAAPATPPGALIATLRVSDPSAPVLKDVPLTIQLPSGDFTPGASPPMLSLSPGGPAQPLAVSATPGTCFGESVAVTPSGLPTGVTFAPPTVTLSPPGYAPQSFQVSAAAGTASGSYQVTLTYAGSGGTTRTSVVTLVIASTPDFVLAVAPASLTLPRPGSASVTVSVQPINGFSGSVAVEAPSIVGVSFSPPSFSVPAGGSQPVAVDVAAGAPAGTFAALFRGTAPGVAGARTAALGLTIASNAPPPEITSVTPPATTPGVIGLVVRLGGRNFQPGAVVVSSSPGVRIEGTTILSSSLADLRLSVPADSSPGRYPIAIVNPDGGRSNGDAAVLVYPRSSLGAPLGVTDAAIVYPPEGTFVAEGDAVYPRALLAVTGTGTIVAAWTIDGAVFDRVTATVAGGLPTELRAHVPIPSLPQGGHRLALVIESPRLDRSPEVEIVATLESSSRLRLLAPRDGAVFGPRGGRFRWSLVPFASGYEVLVRRKGSPLPRRFRTPRADWAPNAQDLTLLPPGIHEWAVRPVFPGEVPGEPTPWRRFALLPERVELTLLAPGADPQTGRTVIRWSGGMPGLLYRVEFLREGESQPRFSALTAREEYRLPAGSPFAGSEYRARVTAYGPGGVVLGRTGTEPARSQAPRTAQGGLLLATRQEPPTVTTVEPADGATVADAMPTLTVAWSRAVPAAEIALILDATDVTAVSQITEMALTYRPLLPLSVGEHEAIVVLAGTPHTWKFTTTATASETAPGETAEGESPAPEVSAETPARTTDWGLTLLGTVVLLEGAAPEAPDTARLQASTQADLSSPNAAAKFAGDLSLRRDLDPPQSTVQESRNWLVDLAGLQAPWRQEARVGFAPPRFLDGAEILTAGLARGAVEARLSSRVAALSYYHSFDSSPAGVSAGTFGPAQQVDAIALETPWDPNRLLLRAIGLRAETEATAFNPGGRGDLVGLLGRWTASPALSVLFEGARSDFEPAVGPDRDGWAFRIGLAGIAGTFQYAANLRYTDADFVNPANPGFTPGGIADRTGGDVSLMKSFGASALSLQFRHIEGGTTSGSTSPSSRENGGNLSYQAMLTPQISVALSGNLTQDSGAADEALSLPAIDRLQYGGTVTATQTPGAISFSETYAYQRLTDEVSPQVDTTVQTVMLNAAGTLAPNFSLAALVSGTRSEGSETIGTTDLFLASVQPILAIPAIWISLQPRWVYSHTKNSLFPASTQTEQYQAIVAICPPYLRSLFSIELSGDWNRSRTTGQPKPGFTSRFSGAVTIRWGAGAGAAAPPATILPGTTPFAPPQSGAGSPAPGPSPAGASP